MGIFGVDVSNHNPNFRDFRGWDFAFIKASEGNGFTDWLFNQHLTNARAAGCLVAAYHYQRDVSAQSQVDLIKKIVPTDVPVIVDVEHGSGSLAITREIIRLLRDAGYVSPLVYIPRWYWQQIGSPDLSGLPRLWASWYPDYEARPREQGIAMVPTSAWSNYGNNSVAMMQFTSSPFDQNWYPGTRDELASLLGLKAPGGGRGDADMPAWNEFVTVESPNDATYKETHPYGYVEGATFFRVADMYKQIPEMHEDITALKEAVEAIQVGGVDLDALADKVAEKVLAKLDVDLVARPQGS
jgi:lysozyme